MSILWLGDPRASDPERVGSKAARLSALAASARVPRGFCLPVETCERLRRGPSGGAVRGDVAGRLAEAYGRLGTGGRGSELRVAVRSTALVEDGTDASFAGQFTTVLGVRGAERLLAAVEAVLASVADPRVAAYGERRGTPAGRPAMAVLVQEMVLADASAVAFTVDPATGDRSAVVVEACWGLGPALVEGWVRPDRYRILREDGEAIDADVAEKLWMAIPGEDGVRRAPVPAFLRRRPALDLAEARAVARAALAAERHFAWPVDLECALRGGAVHVLQCRPITAAGQR